MALPGNPGKLSTQVAGFVLGAASLPAHGRDGLVKKVDRAGAADGDKRGQQPRAARHAAVVHQPTAGCQRGGQVVINLLANVKQKTIAPRAIQFSNTIPMSASARAG